MSAAILARACRLPSLPSLLGKVRKANLGRRPEFTRLRRERSEGLGVGLLGWRAQFIAPTQDPKDTKENNTKGTTDEHR